MSGGYGSGPPPRQPLREQVAAMFAPIWPYWASLGWSVAFLVALVWPGFGPARTTMLFATVVVALAIAARRWPALRWGLPWGDVLRWWARRPPKFDRTRLDKVDRSYVRSLRREWPALMAACAMTTPEARRSWHHPAWRHTPWLVSAESWVAGVIIVVRCCIGQSPKQFANSVEKMASAFHSQVEVQQVSPDTVKLSIERHPERSPLRMPIRWRRVPVEDLDRVQLGLQADGSPMLWPVAGGHTIVVGATGAGKGSVLWSIVLQLADLIRAGVVQLHIIDLKGGVEFAKARPVAADLATTPAEALELIASMHSTLVARLAAMQGTQTRLHSPTVAEPYHLLLIDEAATFADLLERKDLTQVLGTLKSLLAQGRAAGVGICAALQDPTKESFAARDLFTRQIILRLRSEQQTRIALALGADEIAPPAHLISENTPGVGYARNVGSSVVTQFRAFHCPDELIDEVLTSHVSTGGTWS